MPDAILIAGPNGAGKTTFARQVLRLRHPRATFLNADEIQREDPRFGSPIGAGRELLRRMEELETRRESLAVETTLSSRMYARRFAIWSTLGYRTVLHFIELPSEDYAIARVARRVAAGGHSVPDADIRRKRIPDRWYHWTSDDGGIRLVDQSPK